MNYDTDKVDEMVMVLLYLTITEQNEWGARTSKSHDRDALERAPRATVHLRSKEQGEVGSAESARIGTGQGGIRTALRLDD
jgi:hypothetical protein